LCFLDWPAGFPFERAALDDAVIYLLISAGLLLLAAMPIMTIVALVRSAELKRRLSRLENAVRTLEANLRSGSPPGSASVVAATAIEPGIPANPTHAQHAEPEIAAEAVLVEPSGAQRPEERQPSDAASLEWLIGGKALGWIAVVVLLFATGFFLRYAFENKWIGPLGRVTLGLVAGVVLVVRGASYRRAGWVRFSQMLSAAGIVLLYLSTYSAFGFYHLLSQQAASIFLLLIVAGGVLLAVRSEAPAIALMAVVGGLLTPVLMHSEHDQYISLFLYLVVLDAGVVWLLRRRPWPAIGTVALLGTQGLYWLWELANYHPEKRPAALVFQLAVFVLFLTPSPLTQLFGRRRASWEDVVRYLLNAVLSLAAVYALVEDDYHRWLGSLAIGAAAIYALLARGLLARAWDGRLVFASLAIAAGYVAVAIPLEAHVHWVALGWAAEAGALWWFGCRVGAAPLRLLAGAAAGLAGARIMMDTPPGSRTLPFMPILNGFALPALAAVACLVVGIAATRQVLARRVSAAERTLVGVASIACALLIWFIVSVDLSGYFQALSFQARSVAPLESVDWRRVSLASLSVWWAVYAGCLLAIGFRAQLGFLRWTALGLFALTILKVFFFDMSELDEIYRIAAFFALAVLLGVAAWAYQRWGRRHADAEAGLERT
jgi:uncharacterized membrane protein